jgi:hypothetical protein
MKKTTRAAQKAKVKTQLSEVKNKAKVKLAAAKVALKKLWAYADFLNFCEGIIAQAHPSRDSIVTHTHMACSSASVPTAAHTSSIAYHQRPVSVEEEAAKRAKRKAKAKALLKKAKSKTKAKLKAVKFKVKTKSTVVKIKTRTKFTAVKLALRTWAYMPATSSKT